VAIAFLIFVVAMGVSRSLTGRRERPAPPDQELVALGAANLATAFLSGYPVGASISRSAVAHASGARSALASMFAGGLVVLTSVLLAPALALVPTAVLAALIFKAAIGMFDGREFRRVWHSHRAEIVPMLATFGFGLGYNLVAGIAMGVASSAMLYLWKTSQPRIVEIRRLEGTEQFRSEGREGAEPRPSPVLAVRIDQDLYFANAGRFEVDVLERIAALPEVRHLIVDLGSVNELDASAEQTLERLRSTLEEARVQLHLSAASRPVTRYLDHCGLLSRLPAGAPFESTDEAFESLGVDEEE